MTNTSARLFETRGEPVHDDVNCTVVFFLSLVFFATISMIFLALLSTTKKPFVIVLYFAFLSIATQQKLPPPSNMIYLCVYCSCLKSPPALKRGRVCFTCPKSIA